MVLRQPTGLKAALGENPKRVYGAQHKRPATRMGNAAVLRAALTKARDYLRKWEAAADKPDKQPDLDLQQEMVAKVLRREIPLRIHAHRADDILTAIRIAEEFDIDISVEHCTEGHKIADILAAKAVGCAIGPSVYARSKQETRDRGAHTAGVLAKAGAKVALICDHPIIPQQWLRIAAGTAIREGLSEDHALVACTRNPAEMTGVLDRIGTLEPGKDADLVIWDGDPFEYLTKTRCVLVDGQVVHCQCSQACSPGGTGGRCC
jgi:imidazolonepropionase-like amidohydrolase